MLDVNMDGTMHDIAKHLTMVKFKQHRLSKKTINQSINQPIEWIQSITSIKSIKSNPSITIVSNKNKPTLLEPFFQKKNMGNRGNPHFFPFFWGFLFPTTNEKLRGVCPETWLPSQTKPVPVGPSGAWDKQLKGVCWASEGSMEFPKVPLQYPLVN